MRAKKYGRSGESLWQSAPACQIFDCDSVRTEETKQSAKIAFSQFLYSYVTLMFFLFTLLTIIVRPIMSSTQNVFAKFIKSIRNPTEEEVKRCKNKLLNSNWSIRDDVISTYPSKQMYVTLQSLLDKSHPDFMESLNTSYKYEVNKNINDLFKPGNPLPIGYSLAYCNPLSNESELSEDGYDNYHAPILDNIEFFKRRMWVSGSFTFNKSNPLRFGDELKFNETVEKVKFLSRNGIISADYKRYFSNVKGISLIEERRLCYLNSDFEPKKSVEKKTSTLGSPDESIEITPSIISTFRMCALTFNSHQIHYNPPYAQNVEKYPNVVVEAPLLIALSLQFWSNLNPGINISAFKYKITSPSFINDPITINFKKNDEYTKLWIQNSRSVTCFESTIKI